MKQVTLSEIAQKAGVSISAVSRILTGKKLNTFTKATINRVQSIASDLNYRPNRTGQSMRSGQTGLIGVMMPSCGDFYGLVVEGIHDYLSNQDKSEYIPIVLWSKLDSKMENKKTELEQIHALIDRRVEGIILKPTFDEATDNYFREIHERQIPLVTVDRALPFINSCFVGTDDQHGVEIALNYLKSLGHTSIGFFGVETKVSTGANRLKFYRSWLTANPKIKGAEYLIPHWEPKKEDANMIFAAKNPPTALFCVSDHFALAVSQKAAELKVNIPDDLSLLGYGNSSFSSVVTPALSTILQHPYEIGKTAAQRLLLRIENNKDRATKELIAPELLMRQSTVKR